MSIIPVKLKLVLFDNFGEKSMSPSLEYNLLKRVVEYPTLFLWIIFAPRPKVVVEEMRRVQAFRLWILGWGKDKYPSFEAYLDSIPAVPSQFCDRGKILELPLDTSGKLVFDRLVLVDTRGVDFKEAARRAGIGFIPFPFKIENLYTEERDVYWIPCRDGFLNENTTPSTLRRHFHHREIWGTSFESVFLYAQDSSVIYNPVTKRKHGLDSGGTRDSSAQHCRRIYCLSKWRGANIPRFGLTSAWGKDPRCGSWTRYVLPTTRFHFSRTTFLSKK